jgi:F-box/leucine-rich repeat protein 4
MFKYPHRMNLLNRNDHSTQNKISQFVQDVIDFSSQYGKEHSKSYTACNIRSMPTHYPKYGDYLECCVFRTYGPWWLNEMLPSFIKMPAQVETRFISDDFIG